jgi:hypothetical protein
MLYLISGIVIVFAIVGTYCALAIDNLVRYFGKESFK